MTFAVRLRTYQPATDTPVGFLPEPTSFKANFVHNDDGALVVKYSQLADAGEAASVALETGLDVAFEVNWTGSPTGWIEPFNSRFLLLKRNTDPADDSKMHELTFMSYSWLLSRVRNLNLAAVEGSKSSHAGKRKMSNKDAGDIMKTFLAEHEARGHPVPITRASWTTTVDSLGVPWAVKRTLYYDVGQEIHSVLDNLTDLDLCDWRFAGRDMRMYNADGLAVDLSGTVFLTMGHDLGDAPSEESMEDYLRRILVKGSKKKKQTVTAGAGPTQYGDWEGYIDDGGVDSNSDLIADGNKEFAAKNRFRGTYDRDLTLAGDWLPFRDYNPGDWVTGPAIVNSQRMRVQEIVISGENGVLSGSVTLNDRVIDKELARASKLASVAGGVQAVTGSGTSSDDLEPDLRQPEAPTGLTVTPSLYLTSAKRWAVRLAFTWAPVTTATDGTDLGIAAYTVWGASTGDVSARMIGQAPGDTPALTVDGFTPGSIWTFTVQAIGVTTVDPGLQSATVGLTLPTDTTPPPKPSPASLESAASIITATWDGLDYTGAAMPEDLRNVAVLADLTNPPTTVVGNLDRKGSWTGYADAGGTVYVRLVAFDYAGNESAGSDVTSIYVRSILDDTDLAELLATKARIYMQDTTPDDPVPPGSWWFTESTPKRLAYTELGTVAGTTTWEQHIFDADQILTAGTIVAGLLAAGAVTAGTIAADAVTADNIGAGEILTRHMLAHSIEVDVLTGGLLEAQITLSGIIRTAETGARVTMDSDTGIVLYDDDGNEVIAIRTDGTSSFYGKLTASELTVNGIMSLNSADNMMNPGSTLILNAGIQKPSGSPVVGFSYPAVRLKNAAGGNHTPLIGVCRGGAGYLSGAKNGNYWAIQSNNLDGTFASITNITEGGSPILYNSGRYNVVGSGLARGNGSDLWVLRSDNKTADRLSTLVPYAVVTAAVSVTAGVSPSGQPALGYDGTGLIAAYVRPSDGKQTFMRTTQSGVNWVTTTRATRATALGGSGCYGVAAGTFDIGTEHFAFAEGGLGYVSFTLASSGAVVTNQEFMTTTNSNNVLVGMGWDSTNAWWWTADTAGRISFYDGPTWVGAQSQNYDFAYTFYNPAPYQSKVGPRATFPVRKRARVALNVPGWVPGLPEAAVTQLRLYAGTVAGTLWAQATNALGAAELTTIVTTGSNPPANSSFPQGVPAKILSNDGALVIDALGGVRLVPERFRGYPIKWVGGFSGDTATITASNYRSLKPDTQFESSGEWTPTWSGDCMVMPFHAWVRITWHVQWEANTGGNRLIGINKNVSVDTLNQSSAPSSTNRMSWIKFGNTTDASGSECSWEGEVQVGDKIMFMVRSTVALKVSGGKEETRANVTFERMLD